jgi:hypothetical protein
VKGFGSVGVTYEIAICFVQVDHSHIMNLRVARFFLYHDFDRCLPGRVDVSMLHHVVDELNLGTDHLFPFVFQCLTCEGVQGNGMSAYQCLVMTKMQSRGRGGCPLIPSLEPRDEFLFHDDSRELVERDHILAMVKISSLERSSNLEDLYS